MALTVVDPLFVQLDAGQTYLMSPRLPGRLRVGTAVVSLLSQLAAASQAERPTSDRDDESPGRSRLVNQLLELGVLIDEDNDARDDRPSPWDRWGSLAWLFHKQIRNAPFLTPALADQEEFHSSLEVGDRPAIGRTEQAPAILLPRVRNDLSMPFRQVLEGRRTHRRFLDEELSLDDVSTLLAMSIGPIRFHDAGELGVLQLRAAAGGGSRHGLETYVATYNVEGLPRSLFAYDSIRHGLVPVRESITRQALEHLTHNQGFYTCAGLGIILSMMPARLSWKYGHPRAYRVIWHDVGHLAQVISMTAHALGLGAAMTAAIRDDETDALLRLDGHGEFAAFAMAVGKPMTDTRGLPSVHKPPMDAF